MNNNIIKEMFDKKINKNKIYQNIINKDKKIKTYTYTLSFICLLLVITLGVFSLSHKKEILEDKKPESIDKIIINEEQINSGNVSIAGGTTDIAGTSYIIEEKVLDKLDYGATYLKKINSLNDYTLINAVKYTYKELSGYILLYHNSKESKSITIFISLNMQMMPREIINQEEILNKEKSTINNQKVLILKNTVYLYEEEYMCLFQKDNIYFDISSVNLSEEEFINIIKDITK